MLAKVVTMSSHAPSTPQLKPDTYPTFELRYVTESAEIDHVQLQSTRVGKC